MIRPQAKRQFSFGHAWRDMVRGNDIGVLSFLYKLERKSGILGLCHLIAKVRNHAARTHPHQRIMVNQQQFAAINQLAHFERCLGLVGMPPLSTYISDNPIK